MNIGNEGVELIKGFEGLELKSYLCPAGVWTVGYGHTITAHKGMVVTEGVAEELLRQDLGWVEFTVNNSVTVPLTNPQYDALCSFVYNVGATAFNKSTLLRLLNEGDYDGAYWQFSRWNKGGGKVLKGLVRRREAERTLFADNRCRSLPPKSGAAPKPAGGLISAILALISELLKKDK